MVQSGKAVKVKVKVNRKLACGCAIPKLEPITVRPDLDALDRICAELHGVPRVVRFACRTRDCEHEFSLSLQIYGELTNLVEPCPECEQEEGFAVVCQACAMQSPLEREDLCALCLAKQNLDFQQE